MSGFGCTFGRTFAHTMTQNLKYSSFVPSRLAWPLISLPAHACKNKAFVSQSVWHYVRFSVYKPHRSFSGGCFAYDYPKGPTFFARAFGAREDFDDYINFCKERLKN